MNLTILYKVIFFIGLSQQINSFNFFGTTGGSWCPYQIDKFVSCQVPNGTETYFGSPICWKSLNGSFSCTKRLLRRPRFVQTYKKVKETRYKCCPAYFGANCNLECFNCTSFQILESRIQTLENKMANEEIHKQQKLKGNRKNLNSELENYDDADSDNESAFNNSIESMENEDNIDNDNHEHLENAISSLISNIKDLDGRLRTVENKLAQMLNTIQDVTMTNIGLKSIIQSLMKDKNVQKGQNELPSAANYYKLEGSDDPSNAGGDLTNESATLTTSYPSFRMLETNLARGDIASTLNDDYDEENSSQTTSPDDEYLDPFHLNDAEDDSDEDMSSESERTKEDEFEYNEI